MGAKRYLTAALVALALAAAPSMQADARQQTVAAAPFTVATADSMDLSYPKPDMPCACEYGVRVLDLVRGERENTQVVATATTAVTGLRAQVTAVLGPDGTPADPAAVKATVVPLGFLNVTPSTMYKNGLHTYKGWIPDPIRTDLTAVNVPTGSRQPFWLEITSGRTAAPGSYRVTVALTDAAGARVEQQVEARVWPVTISDRNEVATMLTTHPDQAARFTYGLTDQQAIKDYVRKSNDFLTEYRIEPDDIYAGKVSYNTRTETGPDPDDLKYLDSKGWLNRFSAYYLRTDLPTVVNLANEDKWPEDIAARMAKLTANLNVYASEGLADKAYVYGFDELNSPQGRKFAKQMFDRVKQTYPDLPIVTTLFDASMGQTTALGSVDVWAPELFRYPRAGKQYAQSQGDKVFWYPAIVDSAPLPNWFNGYPPISARMLMGVMTHAEGIDGVLYYNIDRWWAEVQHRPMTDGIYSNWNPSTFKGTAGDGSLYYPGPTGPLGSQRLANVRDGLEDYNLLQELKRRSTASGADPALKVKADRLLAAKHLVDGATRHSKSSEALRRHRTEVLDLITQFDGSTSLSGPVFKLLPIGSSTVDGNTSEPGGTPAANAGARPELWQWLVQSGKRPEQVDFVGPSYDVDQVVGDRDHAGIDGDLAVVRANIDNWMASYQPDAVLMHSGAREVLSETYDLARLPGDLNAVLDRVWAARPDAWVYLSTIGPITQDGADDVARTNRANDAILEVFRTRLESGKNVRLLDNRARIGAGDANADKIHLNNSGYSRAAAGWYGGMTDTRPKRLEAETGTFGGLAKALDTYYASNKRKAGKIDDASSFVELTYNAPHAGTYRLMVSGATGVQQPAAHNLSVNGGPPQTVTYAPYGWEKWVLRGLEVQFKAGRNTIRVTKAGSFAEVDFIDVVPLSGDRKASAPTYFTRDALDRLVYVVRKASGGLAFGREGVPGGAWRTSDIQASAEGTPSVALDATGRVHYFARTADGKVLHGWEQTIGKLDWQSSLVTPVAAVVGDPIATLDSAGELVYVARTASGLVLGRGGSTTPIVDAAGGAITGAGEPAAALDRDGALTIAVRTADGKLLIARQTAVGSATFTPFVVDSGLAGRPGLGVDANGWLTYVVRRTDGKLQHGWGLGTNPSNWQSMTLEPKTDVGTIETVTVAGDPMVDQEVAGKLTYAVRTTDGRILHGWQNGPALGPWHATVLPVVTGGTVQGEPQLVLDATNRLSYVARTGERLVFGRQNTPGLGPWNTALIG